MKIENLQDRFKIIEDILVYRGRKPRNALEAWEITFAKWEILELESLKGNLINDGKYLTCGLCQMFTACDTCPIATAGFEGCVGTPYYKYTTAIRTQNVEKAAICAHGESMFLKAIYQNSIEDTESKPDDDWAFRTCDICGLAFTEDEWDIRYTDDDMNFHKDCCPECQEGK